MVWARSRDTWQGFIKVIKDAEAGINRVVPCPRDMRLSSLLSSVLFGDVGGEDTPRPVNARDLSQTGTSWVSHQNDHSYDVEASSADSTLNQTGQGANSVLKESQSPMTRRTRKDCLETPRKGMLRTPASSKAVTAELLLGDSVKKKPSVHRRSSPFIAANHKTVTPQEIKERLAVQRQQGVQAPYIFPFRRAPLIPAPRAAAAQQEREQEPTNDELGAENLWERRGPSAFIKHTPRTGWEVRRAQFQQRRTGRP